jgi:hypothetical protein
VQIKTTVPDNENTFKAARQLPLPFRNTHHFIILAIIPNNTFPFFASGTSNV